MADNVDFIECTSLSFSYDVFGLVTVSYVVVHNYSALVTYNEITAGNKTFTGYVTSATVSRIPNTTWYETKAVLIATTD